MWRCGDIWGDVVRCEEGCLAQDPANEQGQHCNYKIRCDLQMGCTHAPCFLHAILSRAVVWSSSLALKAGSLQEVAENSMSTNGNGRYTVPPGLRMELPGCTWSMAECYPCLYVLLSVCFCDAAGQYLQRHIAPSQNWAFGEKLKHTSMINEAVWELIYKPWGQWVTIYHNDSEVNIDIPQKGGFIMGSPFFPIYPCSFLCANDLI